MHKTNLCAGVCKRVVAWVSFTFCLHADAGLSGSSIFDDLTSIKVIEPGLSLLMEALWQWIAGRGDVSNRAHIGKSQAAGSDQTLIRSRHDHT